MNPWKIKTIHILVFRNNFSKMFFFCFSEKAPSEASFRGSEYLTYDLNQTGGEPIVSTQDAISLHFKTRFPNGLLFYTGKPSLIFT